MQLFKTIVLAAALAACGGKKERTVGTDEFTEGMAALKGYTDRMCACTDAACAKAVDAEQDTWEKGIKSGTKPTGDQLAQFTKAKTAYRECRDKLLK